MPRVVGIEREWLRAVARGCDRGLAPHVVDFDPASLRRGTGALGFYETREERTAITSIRLGSEVSTLPAYEYLSTESAAFAKYADARANRRDPFFIVPAGGADICNIPVPVRRVK